MPTELSPGLWLLLAILAIAFVFFFFRVGDYGAKRRILAVIPDRIDFLSVKPEDFPELDFDALRNYTEALEALGFSFALDYTVKTDVSLGRGFARLFTHAAHLCFVEINQLFPMDERRIPMRCSFGSLLEDNWDLSTGDREPEFVSYIWRHPRMLWSKHLRASPAELLAKHLERRQQMIDGLHIALLTDLSPEAYFGKIRKDNAERKAVLESKSMTIIFTEMNEFRRAPKYEWLGDFAEIVRNQDSR